MTFSPNTNNACRNQICDILQVHESLLLGKYLGLPMYIGRRKNETFKFLTENVYQKLQGWSNKSLSKGGKLVLVKIAHSQFLNSR